MQQLGWAMAILAGFILIGMLVETHVRVKQLQDRLDRMHGHLLRLMDRQGCHPADG